LPDSELVLNCDTHAGTLWRTVNDLFAKTTLKFEGDIRVE
jgi:hypothetical protein